jgi:hypothetical protein
MILDLFSRFVVGWLGGEKRASLGGHFGRSGELEMVLFDDIEVFYSQKPRCSRSGRFSPSALERTMICAA